MFPSEVSGLIAVHYERAGMAPQAVSYYRLAAEVAQQVYANQDALNYSERGLALLNSLPDTATRARQGLTQLLQELSPSP